MDVVASLAENDPVGIYKILFPSNKMSENPIIYQNKVFRFLSDDDEVQIETSNFTCDETRQSSNAVCK